MMIWFAKRVVYMCVCVCVSVSVCVCLCMQMHTQDVRLWVSLSPRGKGGILTFTKRASLAQLRELKLCSMEWERWVQGSERFQFSSVAQSCLTLCDPMDCGMPGSPVLHHFPGVCSTSCPLSQWCHPTISSSVIPSSSCPQSFPASWSFPSQLFTSGGQSIGASASVLPMNIPGWSPLGLTGLIYLQSNGLLRVFSSTTVQKHSSVLSLSYGLTLISVHDDWKNHSFDSLDLCWQSDVSTF